MAKAKPLRASESASGRAGGLTTTQSLQFKLGALFFLALVLLAGGAFMASRTLVQDELLDQNFRYEQEAGLHLTADLRTLIGDTQSLAHALANLAADPNMGSEALRSVGPTLVATRPSYALVASLGIWPEPNALPGSGERGSHYWMRDGGNKLKARDDYNDLRSAPYYKERWYTPARAVKPGSGFWTDRRLEPLLSRYVLTYVVPIRSNGGFAGVATVSVDAAALNERFAALANVDNAYAVLLDGGERVIAVSTKARAPLGTAAAPGTTLANLAKAHPAYAPVALAAFKRNEAQRAAMTQSRLYDAKQVSALKDGTRELSRQEAEDILTAIWAADLKRETRAGGERDAIASDPVLGEAAWASVFDLENPAWTLLRVTPASEGYSGASYLFQQSLVVTLGLVTLTLVLAFFVLRALVIRPLRQMIEQLSGTHTIEDALSVVLDASARNEVGMLAHWQNERIRQLREAMDMSRVAKSQLTNESSERRQVQEQLQRVQERTALALQSVSDAVVTTDERGNVEDMNLAAEVLTGVSLREARGRPLEDAIHLTVQGEAGYQNLARIAIERGARLEYTEGVTLESLTGGTRELVLNGSPLRSRGQMVGAVLAFHERARREARDAPDSFAAASRHQRDLLTALDTRAGCERRLLQLLEHAKAAGVTHGLIYVDLDHLKRVNDTGGQAAGDDVLVRVAETLSSNVSSGKDVYRIAADQFVILAESLDAAALAGLAERLREQLGSTRFYWESHYFSITASLGVVLLDASVPTASEAIRRGDDACAAAKRAGRNNVQAYDSRMDRVGSMVDDDTWVRCIRRGLSDNLFHLRTQWILAGKDYAGEGQCYEVLLALEDEEGFWAAPAAFMPVAERHHLTTLIDRWVIENTLRHLESNPAVLEAMAFCSINLSTATLAEPAFLDFITETIARYPHLAAKLCFEIKEPSLVDHPREAMLCCDVLHRLGCRLCIDHYFGRNLSDLTMLRKLPVDFVKLDAQGFKSLAADPIEHMLAESILRIVRHLRRRVIVNNIDDMGAMEGWKKLGADYFQGYAFAKPTPVPFLAPQ